MKNYVFATITLLTTTATMAVISLLFALRLSVRSRAWLHLEILALRHQLHVLERHDLGGYD